MIPRLHYFYGPADSKYGSWWNVPTRLLRPYIEQLSVLHAREAIHRVNQIMFGNGVMDKDHGERFMEQLQAEASGVPGWESARPARPTSMAEMQAMAGTGVEVAAD